MTGQGMWWSPFILIGFLLEWGRGLILCITLFALSSAWANPLNKNENQQVNALAGLVICPGTKLGNEVEGNGFLYDGRRSLIFSAHQVIDSLGRWREPLENCYWESRAGERIYFEKNSAIAATANPSQNEDLDLATALLRTPFGGATAISLFTGDPLGVSEVISVSVSKKWSYALTGALEVRTRSCRVTDQFNSTESHGAILITDCELKEREMGAAQFVKANGKLLFLGIAVASQTEGGKTLTKILVLDSVSMARLFSR
ncbi:MAG: hypothetical protein AB7F86_13650 [Bdellovibrionales bacterium]